MVIMNFITIVLLHFHIFSLLNVLTPNVTKQMFFKCIYKYNVKYNKLYNLYHDQIYSLLYTEKLEFSVFTPKPGHYFESPAPSFYFLHCTNHQELSLFGVSVYAFFQPLVCLPRAVFASLHDFRLLAANVLLNLPDPMQTSLIRFPRNCFKCPRCLVDTSSKKDSPMRLKP